MRDIVMDMGKYMKFFETRPPFAPADLASIATTPPPVIHTVLRTSLSGPGPWGEHRHTISLTELEFSRLTMRGRTLDVVTSEENGHAHSITVDYVKKTKKFRIIKCDGRSRCFDGHLSILTPEV